MKTWNKPEVAELHINGTEYGQAEATRRDYVFKDQNGHLFYSYSGTGNDTNNRKDIVDPVNP